MLILNRGSIDTWRRNSIRSNSPATSPWEPNQSTVCVGCFMMSELPCACVCEHVKKKQDAGVVQQALHTVRTEDIRAHARAQMLHPLRPPFDTSEEGFCVLPDDGGRGGGEEAAEVPYVRKSCSLHHKDHMLASESQRGGRARRGRTERKDYRRAEGGRVCM